MSHVPDTLEIARKGQAASKWHSIKALNAQSAQACSNGQARVSVGNGTDRHGGIGVRLLDLK